MGGGTLYFFSLGVPVEGYPWAHFLAGFSLYCMLLTSPEVSAKLWARGGENYVIKHRRLTGKINAPDAGGPCSFEPEE